MTSPNFLSRRFSARNLKRNTQESGVVQIFCAKFEAQNARTLRRTDFSREIFLQKNSSTKVIDILSKDYPAKARRPLNSRLECSKILSDFQIERPNWKKDLAHMLNEM